MSHNKVFTVLTAVIIMVVFFYVRCTNPANYKLEQRITPAVVIMMVVFFSGGYTNAANYKLKQRITPMENKNNSSVDTINQMYLKYEAELGL